MKVMEVRQIRDGAVQGLWGRRAVLWEGSEGREEVSLLHTFIKGWGAVSVPSEEKEDLRSEGTPQTHYFRMRNHSQAFLSDFLLEATLSRAKNNLSGESQVFLQASWSPRRSRRSQLGPPSPVISASSVEGRQSPSHVFH